MPGDTPEHSDSQNLNTRRNARAVNPMLSVRDSPSAFRHAVPEDDAKPTEQRNRNHQQNAIGPRAVRLKHPSIGKELHTTTKPAPANQRAYNSCYRLEAPLIDRSIALQPTTQQRVPKSNPNPYTEFLLVDGVHGASASVGWLNCRGELQRPRLSQHLGMLVAFERTR